MKFFRSITSLTLLRWTLLCPLLLPASHAQAIPSAAGQTVDRIVAVVNEAVITQRELEAEIKNVKHRLQQAGQPMLPDEEWQPQILQQMILEQIQLQQAAQEKIFIDDLTLARLLENVAQGQGLSLEAYRAQIEGEGTPWPVFVQGAKKEFLLGQLRQKEVDSKVVVSDAEIARYLAHNAAQDVADQPLKVVQTHVRHILIRVGDGISEFRARQKLDEIRQEISAGGDFAAFARAESQDGSASQGGELGWLGPGETVPEFEQAMGILQEGAISQPVRSEYGYHLIQVLGRREADANAQQKTAHARQTLAIEKSKQIFQDWLLALQAAAYIEYRL
jgi:peptidyl-prolyl cis-trans isomerase SurA